MIWDLSAFSAPIDASGLLCMGVVGRWEGDPASYLLALSKLGEHDNEAHFFLPHHLPEVRYSVWHGALGSNVDLLLAIIALRGQSMKDRDWD